MFLLLNSGVWYLTVSVIKKLRCWYLKLTVCENKVGSLLLSFQFVRYLLIFMHNQNFVLSGGERNLQEAKKLKQLLPSCSVRVFKDSKPALLMVPFLISDLPWKFCTQSSCKLSWLFFTARSWSLCSIAKMKHFQLLNKIGMPLALKSVGVLQIVKMTKLENKNTCELIDH